MMYKDCCKKISNTFHTTKAYLHYKFSCKKCLIANYRNTGQAKL
uniref:Uncharacterized protein n=1 Tax=Rhizophora mucronata TaxID=61149 RepID=A0A2P2QMA4_RHIMU